MFKNVSDTFVNNQPDENQPIKDADRNKAVMTTILRFALISLLGAFAPACGVYFNKAEADSIEKNLYEYKKLGDKYLNLADEHIATLKEHSELLRRYAATLEEYNESKHVNPEDLPERLEMLEINGNPKFGTVIHIRQIHSVVSYDEADDKVRARVANYQKRILQELQEMRPDIIMPESEISSNSQGAEYREGISPLDEKKIKDRVRHNPEDPAAQFIKYVQKLRDLFTTNDTARDEDRARELYDLGADNIYIALNPSVNVISSGTIDVYSYTIDLKNKIYEISKKKDEMFAEQEKKYKGGEVPDQVMAEFIKKTGELDQEMKVIEGDFNNINDKREKDVAGIIDTLLKKFPGKTIAVVYGAAHNFCDDISEFEDHPVLKSIMYPRLYGEDINKKAIMPCGNYKGVI